MNKLLLFTSLFGTLTAHAGGRITLDPINHIANLDFRVVIYSDKTSPGMARVLRDYTNNTWRGKGLLSGDAPTDNFINHQGTLYKIVPHIDVQAMSYQEGVNASNANQDPTVNFFYVNYGAHHGGSVSWVPSLGSNCGYLEVNMQLDTLAHEMGHNLYLQHRAQNGLRPPLMYPWVDEAAVLQETDVNQITLPAPNADGSFTLGELCTPSDYAYIETESESGSSWDFAYLAETRLSTVQIFPNPVPQGQTAKIRLQSNNPGEGELRVFNLQGQHVFTQKVVMSEGDNQLELSTANLRSAGMYIVRLYRSDLSRKDSPTAKLIVQ